MNPNEYFYFRTFLNEYYSVSPGNVEATVDLVELDKEYLRLLQTPPKEAWQALAEKLNSEPSEEVLAAVWYMITAVYSDQCADSLIKLHAKVANRLRIIAMSKRSKRAEQIKLEAKLLNEAIDLIRHLSDTLDLQLIWCERLTEAKILKERREKVVGGLESLLSLKRPRGL